MSTLISPRSRSDQDWPGYRLLVRAPLLLDCGIDFGPFTIAYQTYGTLNPDRSNAILVCHALTGDQYAADPHPITGKPGWWETMVGPGRVLSGFAKRTVPDATVRSTNDARRITTLLRDLRRAAGTSAVAA